MQNKFGQQPQKQHHSQQPGMDKSTGPVPASSPPRNPHRPRLTSSIPPSSKIRPGCLNPHASDLNQSKSNPTPSTELLLRGKFIRVSDGEFKIIATKPESEVNLATAAATLGISKSGVRRLCMQGLLQYRRPSPRRTLITMESIQQHRESTQDPEFWDQQKPQSKTI